MKWKDGRKEGKTEREGGRLDEGENIRGEAKNHREGSRAEPLRYVQPLDHTERRNSLSAQLTESWVQRFRVQVSGFEVSGSRFLVSGFGFRIQNFGFRGQGFEFRVSGFGFQVLGFGLRVSGFGFRVSGFESGATRIGFLNQPFHPCGLRRENTNAVTHRTYEFKKNTRDSH